MKGVIVLIVFAILAYIAFSFFPLFSTPFDLENKLKSVCKDWLRMSPMEKTDTVEKTLVKRIKNTIAEQLRYHEYNEKELNINIPGKNSVTIRLPYKVIINLAGFRLTFDKNLDFTEQRSSF
jgi:hypothetical protein